MEQQQEHTSRTTTMIGAELRVLLVDDNKVNQFLGKRILNNLGITLIDVAGSGHEALQKISEKPFDVLLTDVEMPGMTGYELSKQIRSTETAESRLTIIALTANASDEDRDNAIQAGIDDYLTKPYSPQDLLDVLKKYTINRKHLVMEEINPTEGNGIEKLYAVFNHNTHDVNQFLKMLHQQLPALIHEISNGLNQDQRDIAYNAAHKLKSPVKMLSGEIFTEEFSKFTESLRNGLPLDQARTTFQELEKELEGLLSMINSELEKNGQ